MEEENLELIDIEENKGEDNNSPVACYISEINEKVIEVALWGKDLETGESIVTISNDEVVMTLSLREVKGLFSSIELLFDNLT